MLTSRGTSDSMTLTFKAWKHFPHCCSVIQAGKYEARTLWTTLPPKFTTPLLSKILLVGINYEQVSFLMDVPPMQVQPASVWQSELHPSPFLVFPSSQDCSNLLPSPQTSSHEANSSSPKGKTTLWKPGAHSAQLVSLSQDRQ